MLSILRDTNSRIRRAPTFTTSLSLRNARAPQTDDHKTLFIHRLTKTVGNFIESPGRGDNENNNNSECRMHISAKFVSFALQLAFFFCLPKTQNGNGTVAWVIRGRIFSIPSNANLLPVALGLVEIHRHMLEAGDRPSEHIAYTPTTSVLPYPLHFYGCLQFFLLLSPTHSFRLGSVSRTGPRMERRAHHKKMFFLCFSPPPEKISSSVRRRRQGCVGACIKSVDGLTNRFECSTVSIAEFLWASLGGIAYLKKFAFSGHRKLISNYSSLK